MRVKVRRIPLSTLVNNFVIENAPAPDMIYMQFVDGTDLVVVFKL